VCAWQSEDANCGANSLEEKPSHGSAGPKTTTPPALFASVAATLPPGVLDAFLSARKLRRWLVQIRRDIVNSDDKVYEKLAPGIEERGRMLVRLRPVALPPAERGGDPEDLPVTDKPEVRVRAGLVAEGVLGHMLTCCPHKQGFCSPTLTTHEWRVLVEY
jgi:hypothetical protein